MRKIYILLLIIVSTATFAQDKTSFWRTATGNTATGIFENKKQLTKLQLFGLDFNGLQATLSKAPQRFGNNQSNVIVAFPNADGQLEYFRFYEFSNMDLALAEKYPNIKSYIGQSIENKGATIYCSLSPLGFQSMLLNADRTAIFIEPYTKDLGSYAVYRKTDRSISLNQFECKIIQNVQADIKTNIAARPNADDGLLRTFRLALSVTGEYTTYFGGTKALALAAINNTMTRVNGVFEMDFNVHMNLIGSNDLLIYTNAATDPYSDGATGSGGTWNLEVQNTITNTIGNAGYDIGHLFGATGGGGNAGCIGCVCVDDTASTNDKNKGSGFTSPSGGGPQGDNFDIDYVAHEMGHQFGANHTFTHNTESGSIAQMEPGSGSTIMGYAGITAKDVQPHSDAYFHAISIQQVTNNIKTKTCQTNTATGNAIPTANAGLDYTIPKSTSFILTGSGTDANGDTLTYCWEQMDTGTSSTSTPSATNTTGPVFRSYNPSTISTRSFPILSSVLTGSTTTTGTEIPVEALPSVARTLNFRLTVRDNKANGPANNSDDTVITVDAVAGPFSITAPNTVVSWIGNSSQTITWNVAGTTANGINCANVDILMSTNGGTTFPITLLAGTPNDGTQTLTIPNTVGSNNRIMIKGTNHIFYDISNTNFTITSGAADTTAPTAPTLAASGTTTTTTVLSWTGATDNIAVTSYDVFKGGVFLANTSTTGYNVTGLTASSSYTFTVKAKDADANLSVASNGVVVNTSAPDTTLPTAPTLSASGTTSTTTNLSWTGATDNIAVTSYEVYKNAVLLGTTTLTTYGVSGLTPATGYAFTVKAKDAAGNLSAASIPVNITTQALDTTPPSAPILNASGTTGTTTTLAWSGATDNVAVTAYDVYKGGVLVGSTITTTYAISGLSVLTSYTFTVKAKDAAGNVSVASNSVSITTQEFNYCASYGNSVADELIGNVQIGTINNTSVGGTGYTDFSNISTTLTIGSSPTISITPTWTSTHFNEGYAVFIDYNRDGDFTDSDETVWTKAASNTTPVGTTFMIPLTATAGTTRMRVSLKYNAIPTACETFSYGQVEDYTLVLVSPNSVLNLKMNIQAYYDSTTHLMRTVKANQGIGASATDVDDITVELRNATTQVLVATTSAVLKTNGNATCTFTPAVNGSYYISVKHRNAIQTWSSTPVPVGSVAAYDFTTASSKAAGSNMVEVDAGVWAFYSGDVDQSGNIDTGDYPAWESDYNNFLSGYYATDIDGNGNVDTGDYPYWESNYNNFVSSYAP